MSKTLVCIVNEEIVRNYLFVVEQYAEGDQVLVLAARRQDQERDQLCRALSVPQGALRQIVLQHRFDEEIWDTMCRAIREQLSPNEYYWVNLAGGTRFMSLAAHVVFSEFNSRFFFVPPTRNLMIHSMIDGNNDNNDDVLIPIAHRMTVEEYLRIHGLQTTFKQITQKQEYTEHFFDLFVGGHLSDADFKLFEILRGYRGYSSVQIDHIDHLPVDGSKSRHASLSGFLRFVDFPCKTEGILSREEIEYLTGGWFEEYVYYKVLADIRPDDIRIGAFIRRPRVASGNDLDVVFTLGNKLFVLECKTGVDKVSLFHQIVYKASALHEALLGIASHGAICSLSADHHDQLVAMAHSMDIYYCDRDFFTDQKTWMQFVACVCRRARG